MWRTNRKYLLTAAFGFVLLCGGTATYIIREKNEAKQNTPEAKATRLFQALSNEVSIPLYSTKRLNKYRLNDARAEDGAVVIATYESDKGILNVTQQPRPAIDPFGTIKPVATFLSDAGEGRLFPDDKGNPYIIVSTSRTWIIVRSTSERISSDDLKAFCITLAEVLPAANT